MDATRMTRRQQAFRADFRARIVRPYVGWARAPIAATGGGNWSAPGMSRTRPGPRGGRGRERGGERDWAVVSAASGRVRMADL